MPTMLESVWGLQPMIRSEVPEMLAKRRLTATVVEAMRGADVFGMALPVSLGASGLSPLEQFEVIEPLTYADGSVGWCAMIGCDSGYFPGCLDDETVGQVYPTPNRCPRWTTWRMSLRTMTWSSCVRLRVDGISPPGSHPSRHTRWFLRTTCATGVGSGNGLRRSLHPTGSASRRPQTCPSWHRWYATLCASAGIATAPTRCRFRGGATCQWRLGSRRSLSFVNA